MNSNWYFRAPRTVRYPFSLASGTAEQALDNKAAFLHGAHGLGPRDSNGVELLTGG